MTSEFGIGFEELAQMSSNTPATAIVVSNKLSFISELCVICAPPAVMK
jgi:hypothetical protein